MGRSKGVNTADGDPGETQVDGIEMKDAGAEPEKGKRDKKKKDKSKPKSNRGSKAPKRDKAATKVPLSTISGPTPSPSKKRKRDLAIEEIEIDINAPEPPSKRALRKLKKSRSTIAITSGPAPTATPASGSATKVNPKAAPKPETYPEHASQSRSKWGIWIGNLTFATRKPDLEEFFTAKPSPVARLDVTRINLPTNPKTGLNKGFAYVDFATEKALDYALSLSEKLWNGRPVLIKNAKDFSSRNSSASSAAAPALGANLSKNPPSRILFVGNLDFSTTEADLLEHFAFAGNIAKVRLTTFEDTGKCKGFGFVDFEDEESVKRAMLGLSTEDEEKLKTRQGKEELELELEKLQKKRGTIGSRRIKMEYGEDPSVRYKKRFGKDREGSSNSKGAPPPPPPHLMGSRGKFATGGAETTLKQNKPDRPRPANQGAAYSDDIRRTGAITKSSGKRVRFQL